MATAIQKTVKDSMPGVGYGLAAPASGITGWQSLGNAVSTASSPQTFTLALPGPISRGKLRLRAYNIAGAAATTFSFQVVGTDGTSKSVLVPPTPAVGPGSIGAAMEVNLVREFLSELSLTSISVIVTTATASGTGTVDFEIFGS